MTSKEIYESIDQSKLSPKGREFLKSVEKNTKGFTKQNDKVDSVLKKLYADLKAKKPEALKDVTTKTVEKEVRVPTTKSERKKEPKKKTKIVKEKVEKATGKKKVTKPTKTPSTPKEGAVEHISTRASKLAKKEGISFKEARAKLSKEAKEQIKKDEKQADKELDKLLKFVRKDVFEDGEKYPKIYGKQDPEKSSLSADAKRMAKPVGKRVSKNGKTYYEYRDNRSDRNSLPAPKGQYKYKGKTPPFLADGGAIDSLKKDMNSKLDIHSDYYAKGGTILKPRNKRKGDIGNRQKKIKVDTILGDRAMKMIYYDLKGNPEKEEIVSYESGVERIKFDILFLGIFDDYSTNNKTHYTFYRNDNKSLSNRKVDYAEIELYAKGGEIDLFEQYDKQPKKLSKIVEKYEERYADGDMDYKDTEKFLKEVNAIGYTFDSGLDNEPYNLRPMMAKGGFLSFKSTKEAEKYIQSLSEKEFKKLGDFALVYNGKEYQIRKDIKPVDYAKGGRLKVYDESYDEPIKTFNSFEKAKNWVLENHKKYDEITIEDAYLDTIVVDKTDTKDDIEFLFSDSMAKGGRTISIVNDGVKFDKSKYKAVYGDFDKDGIVNIDDANPLDKTKSGQVEGVELRKTFDKLLGVKAELDEIMYDAVETLDEKAPKGADIYARTKTPYSILKKLVEKRMLDPKRGLTDMIGTTIAVDNQKELEKVRDDIDGGLLGKVLDRDDFYKTPNAGYMAYHYIVEYKGVPVEVQLKTKNMKKLHEVSHEAYKNGTLNAKSLDSLSKTFMRADKGDAKAKSEISKLLKDKKLLASKISKGSMEKGGKIGFDGLAKKVAKRYEGKPVKSEFQNEYGKTYNKKEAMEVGRKVAGKVYRQQQSMEKGGTTKQGYDYVPQEAIDELSYTMGKVSKSVSGSNVLSGAYVKSGSKAKTKSKGANDLTKRLLAMTDDEDKTKVILEKDVKEMQKYVSDKLIIAFYLGLPKAYDFKGDYSYGGGIINYDLNRLKKRVADTLKNIKGNKFEMGLKYPQYDFEKLLGKPIIKDVFGKTTTFNDGSTEKYKYRLWIWKDCVIGQTIGSESSRRGGYTDYTYGEEPTLMGGYKSVQTSKESKLESIAKFMADDKNGFVKDNDVLYNGLGGTTFETLDKNKIKYQAGGTLPTPFGQAGLVGETGTMNEMDLFAMGGGLPQGVHQYYGQTYNPAYPTPHGYAKGGRLDVKRIKSKKFKTKKEAEKRMNYLKTNPFYDKNGKNIILRGIGIEKEQDGYIVDASFLKRDYRFAKGGMVDGRYLVSLDGRNDLWRGNDYDEAYDEFINERSKYLYKMDVILIDTLNDETLDYYDAQEDREQDDGFAKGGEIDAFIMKFVKDAPASNLRVDSQELTAKLKKGGKLGRSKHSLMQDRRRVSSESWEVAYQKRKAKLEAGGTLPTPFGQAGLVGETGTMNEMDLFAMGGGLPQGVHQYYGQTYNPAYPTPHGYAKGGEVDEYIVIHTSMNPENFIKKHKLSKYEYEIDESDYDGFSRINFETYPKNQNFIKDESITEFYYEPYEEYAKGGKVKTYNNYYKTDKTIDGVPYTKQGEYAYKEIANIAKASDWSRSKTKIVKEGDKYVLYVHHKGFAKGGKVGRYTRDDIPNFLEKIFNKDFIENVLIQKDQMDINFKDDGFIVGEKDIKAVEKKGWNFDSLSTYGTSGISLLFTRKSFAKGGKTQGYNDRLDESLGNRNSVEPLMMQSYKDRRDESKGMEKSMGNRPYSSVGTMDKMAKGGSVDKYMVWVGGVIEAENISKIDAEIIAMELEEDGYDDVAIQQMAKGGITQGYNDKLDESLGNTKGKRSTKEQNYKDRRNESEAMEKKGGKRKYASVKTMDKGNRKKRQTPMSLAKEIRKEGEKWQDAVKRASAMLKKK